MQTNIWRHHSSDNGCGEVGGDHLLLSIRWLVD